MMIFSKARSHASIVDDLVEREIQRDTERDTERDRHSDRDRGRDLPFVIHDLLLERSVASVVNPPLLLLES
jgi:hypothetical protein